MSGPRTIGVLATAALAMVAATAVTYADRQDRQVVQAISLFLDLGTRLDTVTSLTVGGPAGSITLQSDGTGWTLPTLDGYAADPAIVRNVLTGLADLRLAEAKTALPAWHHLLGVAAPDRQDTRGRRVVLTDAEGTVVVDLIIGDRGRLDPAPSRYVRRPADDQVWLAHGVVDLPDAAVGWVDARLFDTPADALVQIEIAGPDRPTLTIRRDPGSQTLAIIGLPADRIVEPAYRVTNMATVLEDLSFTDVRDAGELAWPEDGARATFRTRAGLTVTTRLATDDDGRVWVRFAAEGDPGSSEASEHAAEIDSRLRPWAFRLPRHKVDRMQATLEDITVLRPAVEADDAPP